MSELITKACQSVSMATDDITRAWEKVRSISRPEGRTLADKMQGAYLADCLEQARKLQRMLERIHP